MKFFLNKQKGFTPLGDNVNKSSQIGFTLIELMVVVGIIAILSSILYANFNEARMIARDKTRMTTLKEVQLALELYKAQNGEYPLTGCNEVTSFVGPTGKAGSDYVYCTNYIPGLVPEFIAVLPVESMHLNESGRGYFYRSDGNSYKLINRGVEVNMVTDFGHEFARCPSAKGACLSGVPSGTYAVYSDGAQDW